MAMFDRAFLRWLLAVALAYLPGVTPVGDMSIYEYCACSIDTSATVVSVQYSNFSIATCTENCTNDDLCVAAGLTAPSGGVYTCTIYRGSGNILVSSCSTGATGTELCFKKLTTTTLTTSTQTVMSTTVTTSTITTTTASTTTVTSTSTCNRGAGDFVNVSTGCCLMSGVTTTVANLSTYHCKTLCQADVTCIGLDLMESSVIDHNCTRYFEVGDVGTGQLTGVTSEANCVCYAKECNYANTITTTTVTVFTATVTYTSTALGTTTTTTTCAAGAMELVGAGCCQSSVITGYAWSEAAAVADCVAECRDEEGCIAADVTAAGSSQLCRKYSGAGFGSVFTTITDASNACQECWRIACLTTTTTTITSTTSITTTSTTCPPGNMEQLDNGCCAANATSRFIIFENWRLIEAHCVELCEADASCVAVTMSPAPAVKAVSQGSAEYLCTTYGGPLLNFSAPCTATDSTATCYGRAECADSTLTAATTPCPLGSVELFGNGSCEYLDMSFTIVGSLLEAHCMLQCDNEPTCIAADVRDPSGSNYLCTLYFGTGLNFTSSNSTPNAADRCYNKRCFTTSSTITRTTTVTRTSTTVSTTTTTHPDADQPFSLMASNCPFTRPQYSHKRRCCVFPGLVRLGDEFTFFQMETCMEMCSNQPLCVAMDYHARQDGTCIFHQLYNSTTTALINTTCDTAADLDEGWECHRRFCDSTTTTITTQSVTRTHRRHHSNTTTFTTTIGEATEDTATNRGTQLRFSFASVIIGILIMAGT